MMRSLLASILFLLMEMSAQAAFILPEFFDSVVALGAERPLAPIPGAIPQLIWQTEGTGFFYGHLATNDPDPAKRRYRVFLVTAKHVVQMHMKAQRDNPELKDLTARLNPKDVNSSAQEFPIPLNKPEPYASWFFHPNPNPNIDLAILSVNANSLLEENISLKMFGDDISTANKAKMKETGVSAGDSVFVLGFPMGLSGKQRNYVVLRHGTIARIDEMLAAVTTTFLLDCFVFPGNSGGPVILKPEIVSFGNTKATNSPLLIGNGSKLQ